MLNKFKVKKVTDNHITAGECLKYKREEMGVTLRDLSNKLRIKASYLEDLERNNYAALPPAVYVRGFIRLYSKFVGFDAEKMVKLYNRDVLIREKIEEKPKEEKPKKKKPKFSMTSYVYITPRIVTIFFTILILSGVGYYFWHQVSSFNSTPYLFVSNPTSDEVVDDSDMTIEGETETGAMLRINGEDIFVDQNGKFKQTVVLQPGRNILVVEATNRFNKSARQELNIIYQKNPEEVPLPQEPVTEKKPENATPKETAPAPENTPSAGAKNGASEGGNNNPPQPPFDATDSENVEIIGP